MVSSRTHRWILTGCVLIVPAMLWVGMARSVYGSDCPDQEAYEKACLTDPASTCEGRTNGTLCAYGGEAKYSLDGPFGCRTSAGNNECLDGKSNEKADCYEQTGCVWTAAGCEKSGYGEKFPKVIKKTEPCQNQ